MWLQAKTRGKILSSMQPMLFSVCKAPTYSLNKTTDIIQRSYPFGHADNVINFNFWNKLLKAERCDVCNKTLTYTLYQDDKEKARYETTSGLSIDKHFNIDVNTSKGFQLKGFLTAEVPNLDDGCRIMNPVPIRLPFDIEVCGLEKIVSKL